MSKQSAQCPNCGNSIEVADAAARATCAGCGAELVVSRDASGQPLVDLADMSAGVDRVALDEETRRRLEGELEILQKSRAGLARVQPLLTQAKRWLLLIQAIFFATVAAGVIVIMTTNRFWLGFLTSGTIALVGIALLLICYRRRQQKAIAPTNSFDEAMAAREAQLREMLAHLDQPEEHTPQNDG